MGRKKPGEIFTKSVPVLSHISPRTWFLSLSPYKGLTLKAFVSQ